VEFSPLDKFGDIFTVNFLKNSIRNKNFFKRITYRQQEGGEKE